MEVFRRCRKARESERGKEEGRASLIISDKGRRKMVGRSRKEIIHEEQGRKVEKKVKIPHFVLHNAALTSVTSIS